MRRTYVVACVGGLVAASLAAENGLAQAPAAVAAPVATTPDSGTEGGTEVKKKGGLFGKVKALGGNNVVQSVAKVAACTMVPGGQVIAGAIDAASSKTAGEAAAGAASAAAGTTCMPGGMGGPAAAGMSGSGVVGMAAQAGAAAAVGGPPGGVHSPDPYEQEPTGDGMGYRSMGGMPGPDELAGCMGLSVEEYQDLTDPTHGEPRQPSKEEMQRQQKLSKKIDMRKYQACMMRASASPPSLNH
jgi:hypothetical protein